MLRACFTSSREGLKTGGCCWRYWFRTPNGLMIAGDSTDQNILMIDWSVDDSNIGQCWSNIDDDWGFPNIWFLMIGEDQNRLWHIVEAGLPIWWHRKLSECRSSGEDRSGRKNTIALFRLFRMNYIMTSLWRNWKKAVFCAIFRLFRLLNYHWVTTIQPPWLR